MTTIVATSEAMYSDSMCSTGDTFYRTHKIYRIRDELLGVAGDNRAIEKFVRWYKGARTKQLELTDSDSFQILVLNRHGLWIYDNCSMPDKVVSHYACVGAGAAAAEAAMLAGATPRRAIEIVCEVSKSSGLPVHEVYLDPKKSG